LLKEREVKEQKKKKRPVHAGKGGGVRAKKE